jgi:hypothetical protein
MDGKDAMPIAARPDTRLTYGDFLLFPDDGKRHEIIDGEHYATPSPNTRHQDLVERLHLALGAFLKARPRTGRVFLAPFDVVLSFHDVVEPDLLLIAGDQAEILTARRGRAFQRAGPLRIRTHATSSTNGPGVFSASRKPIDVTLPASTGPAPRSTLGHRIHAQQGDQSRHDRRTTHPHGRTRSGARAIHWERGIATAAACV